MTREEAEEVAKEAAKQRGQDWNALPGHSRDIWIEAARSGELKTQEQPEEAEPDNGELDDDEAENGPKPKAKRGKK